MIRSTAAGRLYLDQARWERVCAMHRASARVVVLVFVAIGVVMAVAAYYANTH